MEFLTKFFGFDASKMSIRKEVIVASTACVFPYF